MTYKTGRKPPKNAPALRLSKILSGAEVAVPIAVDHLGDEGWEVLGNDLYGDCVAVTWANNKRLVSRLAGKEHYPSLSEVLDFYRTQNPDFPSQDEGMVIQTALEHLRREGQIVAFARVDHTDPEQVAKAIDIFGALWVGVEVTIAQMAQFNRGEVWDLRPGYRSLGGHGILYGAFDRGLGGPEGFITWGKRTFSTDAFWQTQVDEAWVVVWPENLGTQQFHEGIDLEALKREYAGLTGRELALPEPEQPKVTLAEVAPLLNTWAKGIISRHTKAGKAASAWKRYAKENDLGS